MMLNDEDKGKERGSPSVGSNEKQKTLREAAKRDRNRSGDGAMEGSRKSFVYFLGTDNGKFIKIGWTSNVYDRAHAIRHGLPARFRNYGLIGYIAGDRALERKLHADFSFDRVDGEWFRWSVAIADYLESVTLIKEPPEIRLTHYAQRVARGECMFSLRLPKSIIQQMKQAAKDEGSFLAGAWTRAAEMYLRSRNSKQQGDTL